MRKQVIIGALVLSLLISGGSYAISYTTATSAIEVDVAGTEITQVEPALEGDQPDWDSVVPSGGGGDAEILRPDAPGDTTDIASQHPDSGQHWDKVDDAAPDDWSTYVCEEGKHHKRDLYNIQDYNNGSGTVEGIIVYFRFAAGDDGGKKDKARARAVIKTHDTAYTGSEEQVANGGFVTRAYQWTTNPSTGQAWTWDEIDDLQIGVDLRTVGKHGKATCTQVYAVVYYTEEPETDGQVPKGDLFMITPDDNYTGDFTVKVYLANTGDLVKAYQYLNVKLYLEESEEAGETPDYQLLTLENGVVTFHLKEYVPGIHTLSVTGGGYGLVSGYPSEWPEGWSVVPELYCEVY